MNKKCANKAKREYIEIQDTSPTEPVSNLYPLETGVSSQLRLSNSRFPLHHHEFHFETLANQQTCCGVIHEQHLEFHFSFFATTILSSYRNTQKEETTCETVLGHGIWFFSSIERTGSGPGKIRPSGRSYATFQPTFETCKCGKRFSVGQCHQRTPRWFRNDCD